MTIGIDEVSAIIDAESRRPHRRLVWDSDPPAMRRCHIDKNAGKNTDGVIRRAYFQQDVTKDFDSRCRLVAHYEHYEEHGLPYHIASAGWNHIKTPKQDPLNWKVSNYVKIDKDYKGSVFCNRNQAVVVAFDVPYHFLMVNWRKEIHLDRLKASYSGRKGSKKSHDLVYHLRYDPVDGRRPDKFQDTLPQFTFHLSLNPVNPKSRKNAVKPKDPVNPAGLEAAKWLAQYTPKLHLFSDFDSPFESEGAEFAFLARFSSWDYRINRQA